MEQLSVVWIDPNDQSKALCIGFEPIAGYLVKRKGFLQLEGKRFKAGEKRNAPKGMVFQLDDQEWIPTPVA